MKTRATSDKKKNIFAAKKNDELLRLRVDAVELRVHLFLGSLLSAGESGNQDGGRAVMRRDSFQRGEGRLRLKSYKADKRRGK